MRHSAPVHLLTIFLLAYSLGYAQPQVLSVKVYLQQIATGNTEAAKKALPDLLIEKPNDPGVLFLHASLAEDPQKAQPLLERIVHDYSTSEWADDALLRLIIYQSVHRDTLKARGLFTTMQQQYAQSELLTAAYDVVRMSVGLPVQALKTVTPLPEHTTFSIQTLTVANKASAQQMADSFKKHRMKVVVIEKKEGGKILYAVQVGNYTDAESAQKDVGTVAKICKCSPIIVNR